MIDYYLLTKPGIILGNLFTFSAGFLLASKGAIDLWLFFETLLGLGLIIASACVLNNYIDRDVDQRMDRTKKRALASGAIGAREALLFALFLGVAGNGILLVYTNSLTVAVTNVGFFVYVCLYSLLKTRTSYSTLIGSVAGAVPPLTGYCAVSNQLDLAAGILFLMMVFWQMPHFFSIALWHYEDYSKAGIPLLPMCKGVFRTKVHMALYILILIPTLSLLTFFGYTGKLFLVVMTCLGVVWLILGLRGFGTQNDSGWAKNMFRLSLVMITAVCLLLPLDLV